MLCKKNNSIEKNNSFGKLKLLEEEKTNPFEKKQPL